MWSCDTWRIDEASPSEATWLGAPRRALGRAVAFEREIRTAVCWGRYGSPPERPIGMPAHLLLAEPWRLAEADLVWCDHAFGRPGAIELASALQAAMKPGALLAVVDVAEVAVPEVRTWLADRLDLAPAVGVREVLGRLFVPVHVGFQAQPPGWRSFVFLGRR